MLSQVRGALKGAMAWFIVVLLILAFALWGVPELRTFSGSAAITVGDKSFTQQYVQNEFNRAMFVRRQENGGDFTREDAIASGLPDQVVNSIAVSSALDQFTNKMGLAMPREIVRDYLQQNENFQNPATGKFDRFRLESILSQNGITVQEFESRIADELMRNQIIGALTSSGPAPNQLVDAMLLRQTERRRIAYLTVTNDMAGIAAEPTPNDLKTYYQQNQAAFTAPEYRTFDLLILRRSDFAKDLKAPEEELRQLYKANKERLYDKPERRTLYQLTYDTEAEATAAAASLRQGTPFENIARDKGFSLEEVTFTEAQKRDILDPSVAEAAFSNGLTEGAVIDPVKSLFGWTIIQIAGVTPPETKTFEEVRDALEADYLNNDTRRALLNAVDEIEEERDTGASLAAAAEAAGFKVKTFGPVDRFSFAPGGAIVDKILGEALAEAFRLDEGEESEALDLADNDGYFLIALREITPPALLPLDDVRDEIEQRWRKQEREQRISNTIRSIREAVENGQTLEEAAAPLNRAPIEIVIDRRFENETISSAFNEQIFFANLGDLASGPTAIGEAQVVAEIRNITYARNSISASEEDIYKQYIGYQINQELLEAFMTAIREDYGVKVNKAQLDSLFAEAQ